MDKVDDLLARITRTEERVDGLRQRFDSVYDNLQGSDGVRERLARIEEQNEACSSERKQVIDHLRKLELKVTWYAGGLAALIFVIGVLWKVIDHLLTH